MKRQISKVGPVVVATGPKVGSTWVCNILQELGLNLITGHNDQSDIFSDVNASILDLSKEATQRVLASSTKTCLFKSHSPAPDWIENCLGTKFINVYRDPRDLLVSLAFYERLRGEQGDCRFGDSLLDISVTNALSQHISDFRAGRSYVKTIRSWVELDSSNVLALRYEDLHSDALNQVRRIVDFLGADCSDADLNKAIDAVSFEKMADGRKRGQEDGSSFYRKGIVGDWKNYFDDQIVEEFKSIDNGLWNKILIALGYEGDLTWQLPKKQKTIAFVHNWPGAKNSELDLMQRMKDLASKRGVCCVNISPYGDILDDQGNFLENEEIVDPQYLEFVLNFHYTSPNYIDNFSYLVNWNPLNYVIKNPISGKSLDSGHVAYLSSCFQSHDFLLSAESQEMDDFAKCLNAFERSNSNVAAGPLHTTCNVVDSYSFPSLDNFTVFYISANWERQYKVQRHGSLLELMDLSGEFELFGLREQSGVYLWEGIENYKGQLPFDGGKSIIHESNRCGVSLVLHSQAHRDSCLVSTRIFQAAAAKTVIVSDDNPWIVEKFGDSVLTFPYRFGDDQWNYSQISEHLEWIRKNPEEALLKAKQAHKIFVDNFSLDHEFYLLLDQHQAEVKRFETDLCAKNQSACVEVVYEYDCKTINRFVADLESQHLVTPVALFLVSEDKKSEISRYLKLRRPNFKWRIVFRNCAERLGSMIYNQFFEATTPYLAYYHPHISWTRYHLSMLVRKLEDGASIAHCATYVQNSYLQEGKLNDYFVSSQAAMGGYAKAVGLMDLVNFNVDGFSSASFLFKKECFTALGDMLLPIKFFDRGFYLCLIAIAYEEFSKLPQFIGRFNAKCMREDPFWTIQNYDEQARMTSSLEKTVFLSFFKNCRVFRESSVSNVLEPQQQQQSKEQQSERLDISSRLIKKMRALKIYYDLKRSGLFSKKYYLEQNPDVAGLRGDVLWHFIGRGAYEGRNPNPYFDCRYYLKFNPEVAAIGINPLFHYLRHGAKEGRNPSSKFNTVLYMQSNPDVVEKRLNPLAHYLRHDGVSGK